MSKERIYDIMAIAVSNNFILGKYQLYKVNKYQKLFGIEKIKQREKEVKEKIVKNREKSIEDDELKNKIQEFKQILQENFNTEDIKNFNSNLEWLKIAIVNYFKEFECFGIYNADKNLLLVKRDNIDDTLFHELFHLSSTKVNSEYKHVGFLLNYKKKSIGYGLNEGYTELLTCRYCRPENNTYILEKNIASNLEKIIGKEKMQSLYLNGNLYGLVDILKQYFSVDEIEKFLINLDIYTCYYNPTKIVSAKLDDKIYSLIEEINLFLIKGFLYKLKENKNLINEEEIISFLKGLWFIKGKSSIINEINNLIHTILNEDYSITKDLVLEEKGVKI